MVVTNKLVLDRLRFPLTLTTCQLSAAFVITCPKLLLTGFSKVSLRDVLLYALEASLFALSLYANLQALMRTGVGTVIVGRSAVPLITFIFEAMLAAEVRFRTMIRSVLSLIGVITFSTLYAATDGRVHMKSRIDAFWLTFWIFLVACQMIFGKWLISTVPLGRWERVFYTNSCALPFMLALSQKELVEIYRTRSLISSSTVGLVLISCFVGIGISYSSWRLRELVSPTTFGLVGVVNKMVTVCVSALIWPESFSLQGIVAITGCVLSALLYSGLRGR